MAFCKHCGVYLADGLSTCPSCGQAVGGQTRASSSSAGGSAAQQAQSSGQASQAREAHNEDKNGNTSGSYHYSYRRYGGDSRQYTGADSRYRGGSQDPRGAWRPRQDGNHQSTGSQAPYISVEEADAQANRGVAALSYLSLLFLVPLLLRPKSPFCRFHANQGLLLFLQWIVGSAIFSIGFLGWLAGLVVWGVGIYGFFSGIGAALRGQKRPLPLIGNIRLIK